MASPAATPAKGGSGSGGESERHMLGRLAKSLVLQNYSQVIATISTMATLVYFYFALTGSKLRRLRGEKEDEKEAGRREREREKGFGS